MSREGMKQKASKLQNRFTVNRSAFLLFRNTLTLQQLQFCNYHYFYSYLMIFIFSPILFLARVPQRNFSLYISPFPKRKQIPCRSFSFFLIISNKEMHYQGQFLFIFSLFVVLFCYNLFPHFKCCTRNFLLVTPSHFRCCHFHFLGTPDLRKLYTCRSNCGKLL